MPISRSLEESIALKGAKDRRFPLPSDLYILIRILTPETCEGDLISLVDRLAPRSVFWVGTRDCKRGLSLWSLDENVRSRASMASIEVESLSAGSDNVCRDSIVSESAAVFLVDGKLKRRNITRFTKSTS